MKKIALITYRFLIAFGINGIHFIYGLKNFPRYILTYRKLRGGNSDTFGKIYCSYPCLHDKDDDSGTARGHYFHQDLLIAQKIFKTNPKKHVDIGSRVDGFVAHIATFREIEVLDIRKNNAVIENIRFIQGDATSENTTYINYCDSVSCLHAIEHFGLGRYGDDIDIKGHIKGIRFITRMLKTGGKLYFSTPISKKQRIEFNAHRIFSLNYLNELLGIGEIYHLLSFSYVDDEGKLHKNQSLEIGKKDTFNLEYGCGIFELIKVKDF